MFYQILSWTCAVAGLAAFAYRLPALRRHRRDPGLVALCVYFLCSGLSFLVDLDPLRTPIADALGYPNITTIMTQFAVVVLTAAQQVVLVHWSHPPHEARPRAVRRGVGFGTAAAVLVACFFLLSTPTRRSTAETTLLLNMDNPRYAGYLCLYLGVCAVGQIETVRLSVRYARIANRAWLRRGMWAVTAGGGLILVYCAVRYLEIAGTHLGHDMTAWDPLYWISGSFGSLLALAGWTVPALGPRLSAVPRWSRNYLAYQRLSPLWWALYRAAPSIALSPPSSRLADLLPGRDLEYRLYRRVIEIRDGQLALRPPGSGTPTPGGDTAADPAPGAAPSAAAEARALRAALDARLGRLPRQSGAPAPTPTAAAGGTAPTDHRRPATRSRGDLLTEIARLVDVAQEFRRLDTPGEPSHGTPAPRPTPPGQPDSGGARRRGDGPPDRPGG